MSNKFLGINSINVLKDYIDKQISLNDEKTSIVTIHAYKYAKDGDIPATPKSGSFDQNGSNMIYPEGWSSLQSVVDELGGKEVISDEINYEKLEKALQEGSIWLSVGVAIGSNVLASDTWSTPIKISGQNGVSVKFAYSYDKNATEDQWTEIPSGVNQENRIEYVWTKYADESWSGPTIWSMYSVDASMIIWKYCLSKDIENDSPVNPTPWYKDIPLTSISPEYPYMWMSYKVIPSPTKEDIEGEKEYLNDDTTYGWSQPVLFGHYGKDAPVIGTKLDEEDGVNYWTTTLYDKTDWLLDENGEKLRVTGRDGNAPNYTTTLYKYSEGYLKPSQPSLGHYNEETGKYEYVDLKSFRENNPDWLDVPTLDVPEPIIDVKDIVEVSNFETLTNNLIDGKIIKLSSDIEIPTPIILTKGNVTIDLNGHNITAGVFMESNGEVLEGDSDSYVFWVKGGHLTIQGNGVVKASDAKYSMAVWSNGGDVTIKGGRFENGGQSCDLIYGSARKVMLENEEQRIGGTITIYDGEFYATEKGDEPGTGNNRSALNTKNADMDICKIVVYGGYFHEFDPSNNLSLPGSQGNFLAEGLTVVNNNGVFEVLNNINVKLWWQCTVQIDGINSEVMTIGNVERYTALDGVAKPGQFTQFKYKWFETQNIPDDYILNIDEWFNSPDEDTSGLVNQAESSLWMISNIVKGINSSGDYIMGEWSKPIKLTGPRGPISYDYRIETRYNIGTENLPKSLPTEEEWSKDAPTTTTKYPYVWAATYLVVYKMKYDKDNTIVTADNGTLLESYEPFRLSGINGEDGNKKNSIKYTNSEIAETIKVTSFSENNLYISNSNTDVTYEIELDKLSFINGYTGKFANIGSGKILIKTGEGLIFSGSNIYAHSIELEPQETVELVCYNNDNSKELLVIGKVLTEN